MSDIDKDHWDEKASKVEQERIWAMLMEQIEGDNANDAETSNAPVGENGGNEATNAEISDAPLHENDGETVAGGAVQTGSALPTEDKVTDEAPSTETARNNTPTLRGYCTLCKRVVTNPKVHTLSRRHRNRMKPQARQSASATHRKSPAADPESLAETESPAVNNMPANNMPANNMPATKEVQCGYCDRSYANRERFHMHSKTKLHQENKAQQDREEGRGPDPEPLPRGAKWTPDEDETILRMYWDMKDDHDIHEVLPYRGVGVIAKRRVALLNDSEHEELRERVPRIP